MLFRPTAASPAQLGIRYRSGLLSLICPAGEGSALAADGKVIGRMHKRHSAGHASSQKVSGIAKLPPPSSWSAGPPDCPPAARRPSGNDGGGGAQR